MLADHATENLLEGSQRLELDDALIDLLNSYIAGFRCASLDPVVHEKLSCTFALFWILVKAASNKVNRCATCTGSTKRSHIVTLLLNGIEQLVFIYDKTKR